MAPVLRTGAHPSLIDISIDALGAFVALTGLVQNAYLLRGEWKAGSGKEGICIVGGDGCAGRTGCRDDSLTGAGADLKQGLFDRVEGVLNRIEVRRIGW